MKITYTFIMKVLPALLAALCWTSCSDFLEEDPKGQLPSDTYFSNKEDLDASLTAREMDTRPIILITARKKIGRAHV